ncbi:winged helix-turn-helix domain-containing protein [Ancylobacter moscoviensis]
MASLSIRIDLDPDGRVGPGKIALLEAIARTGSISAAGRAMDMSYKRAWDLVDELGRIFDQPVVTSQAGGRHGGGARLTPFGEELIARYREIEQLAAAAVRPHLDALQANTPRESLAARRGLPVRTG